MDGYNTFMLLIMLQASQQQQNAQANVDNNDAHAAICKRLQNRCCSRQNELTLKKGVLHDILQGFSTCST